MIAAGELDRRITVERYSAVRDALGGEVRTWAALGTVWAEATPVSDGERWRAAEVAADVTHRFVVRGETAIGFVPGVRDRVVYDGRVFEIAGVKEIGRGAGYEITAAARAE